MIFATALNACSKGTSAEGFTGEPIGGCTVGPRVDPEQVARIVRDVVGELRKRGSF